jgi:Ca-activated chloride channel homolog
LGVGFSWPFALLALLALPVLAWWYRRNLERPSEAVAMHPDLELLVRASASSGFSWRRVLPAVLYLGALALGLVALARPTAPLPVPDNKTTIMLSIDVSLSMNADDIAPNRFKAAQEAAKIFVKQLPKGTKIGLVSFAGYSLLNQTPTTDFDAVIRAIDDLELGRGTAIGAGILEALHALPGRGEKDPKSANLPPAAIVLLTDGRSNRPPPPLEAAQTARNAQVKVYTVGLGTENGFLAPNEMGIGGFTVGFDSETLKEIARITGGQYFEARSASQLSSIYKGLGRSIGWTTKPGEVTGVAAALAGLVLFASLLVGQVSRRVI